MVSAAARNTHLTAYDEYDYSLLKDEKDITEVQDYSDSFRPDAHWKILVMNICPLPGRPQVIPVNSFL